jgi:hypothetical protein
VQQLAQETSIFGALLAARSEYYDSVYTYKAIVLYASSCDDSIDDMQVRGSLPA